MKISFGGKKFVFAFVLAGLVPPGLYAYVAEDLPHAGAISPEVLSGTCSPTKTKFKVSTSVQSTTSTSYVNVTDGQLKVKLAKRGCIIVAFTAEAKTAADDTMVVRALRDGTSCAPSSTFFASSGPDALPYADRAVNFVCSGVGPGAHRVRLQFESFSGGAVTLDYRTVVLQY